MHRFFAYTRVSTAKQGERGVSLQEQRDAIERYAARHQLSVVQWFEERVTAAKRGRAVFNHMLRLLRKGSASGVIIHKIDRSARNLRDWADLGELIDSGVEVHFANESLDLQSRGGRLSADIQAVVAADYIRNLKEETRKGFYGRIKQGLFPLPAPIGYIDCGKGKPKEFDPVRAPLVKLAFELYATGRHSLDSLGDELHSQGLRNRWGSRLARNGISVMLNNPFYIGLIRLKRTKETFPGAHEPLIPKVLFDRVHRILTTKINVRADRHQFLLRRLLTCQQCEYSLIGEQQKGRVYYRCHTPTCRTSIRDDAADAEILRTLATVRLNSRELAYVRQYLSRYRLKQESDRLKMVQALTLQLDQRTERLSRLTDAFIDRLIDKKLFEIKKTELLMSQKDIEGQLRSLDRTEHSVAAQVEKILELGSSSYSSYKTGFSDEKREILESVTSNRTVHGKKLDLTLAFPFQEIAKRAKNSHGGPQRYGPRTLIPLLKKLTTYCERNTRLASGMAEVLQSTSPKSPTSTPAQLPRRAQVCPEADAA